MDSHAQEQEPDYIPRWAVAVCAICLFLAAVAFSLAGNACKSVIYP